MFDQYLVRRFAFCCLACLGLIFSVSGCGDDADGGSEPRGEAGSGGETNAGNSLEIEGAWLSNFGMEETISAEAWNTQSVVSFDNAENTAVTQNAADAAFSPEKFNKIVWTEPEADSFYYCTVDYDLDSAELAGASTKTADPEDPETTGCSGFSWTKLTRVLP